MYGTGGGPAKKFDDTSMDNDMEQILGSQMTAFESEFDNDKENIEIEPENVLLIVEEDGNDDDHGSFVEKENIELQSKKKDTGILEDITDAHRDGTNLDRDIFILGYEGYLSLLNCSKNLGNEKSSSRTSITMTLIEMENVIVAIIVDSSI
ncbi:hypothetical protein NQ314_005200 [Rhamnusium bicolor]|uniref:Uncharacterized protein n=1 Tax=Rhamnusium bicolor TaxID=1586634 RepID=A0AAV8ZJD3_9CUCU|nr:hypothetical protein NQ314_005200 [Rhamnusium bicolor]